LLLFVILSLLFIVPSVVASDIIIYEDFEGAWPNTWYVGNDGGIPGYVWGDNYYRSFDGSWSGFCADDGDNWAHSYPNDLHTYMEKREVSLSGYSSATLEFYYWLNCESGYDYFTVNVRDQYGQWHELFRDSGDKSASGWVHKRLSLEAFCGQTGLYIQFRFDSDSSITSEGVWIDNVRLEASATGNLEVLVKDEEGNSVYNALLLLYDADYNYMGDGYIRRTDPNGQAHWSNLEPGDYNIEVYHEGSSPFPGPEFWVSQRVTVIGGETASVELRRNRPFASQVLIKTETGQLIHPSTWIDPGNIRIEITVENKCNWDQRVKVSLILDRDGEECYDVEAKDITDIVSANHSRVFTFDLAVWDTAYGNATYKLALCVRTYVNGEFIKTDAWDWEDRFAVSYYMETGTFGDSLSPPSCPPAMSGCIDLEDDFKNENLDLNKWQIRSQLDTPGGPGKQFWADDQDHCTIVDDPLAEDGKALRLSITRPTCSDYTVGAEVSTRQELGYGTYSVRLRIVGAPGFVVGAFLYKDYEDSPTAHEFTEIDFEWLSRYFNSPDGELFCNSWQDDDENYRIVRSYRTSIDTSQYHIYTFVWEPDRIIFMVDGVHITTFLDYIPWLRAPFVINIWSGSKKKDYGTYWATESNWSGQLDAYAQGNVYIDWFKYTPFFPPPERVDASDGSYASKISVTWSPVSQADRYEVYRATSKDGSYSLIAGNVTSTSYDDTGVSPGQHYWYKVKACNDCGCSDYSSADEGWAQAHTVSTPSTPSGPSSGCVGQTLMFTTGGASDSLGHSVQYRFDWGDGTYSPWSSSTSASHSYSSPGPYEVKAQARCSVDTSVVSAWSSATIVTISGPPSTPTGVSASDGTYADKVRVTWNAVSGATRYEVYRAVEKCGTYVKVGESTTTTYDDTNVEARRIYWYKVRACNACGNCLAE